VNLEHDPIAGHALVTKDQGTACGLSEPLFLTHCGYSLPCALLEWIYGPLADPASSPSGQFVVFNQSPFASEARFGLADEGVV
jgi:hypothetical protein